MIGSLEVRRRVVVVQPRPVAVGVVRWFDPRPSLSIVVKATFGFGGEGDELELVDPQPGLTLDREKGDELVVASDFAPRKVGTDVVVVGHAYADRPAKRIDAKLCVGAWERRFVAVTPTRAERIPLRRGQVVDGTDLPTSVGPERVPGAAGQLGRPPYHVEGDDFSIYNVAARIQRLAMAPAPGAPIVLEGLSRRGVQSFAFPTLAPHGWIDMPGASFVRVPFRCDTLWFDTDKERLAVVWRGEASVVSVSLPEVERIVVTMGEAPPDDDAVLRDLPRASFSFAAEDVEPSPDPRDESESDDLRLARYEAFDHPLAPEPTTTLDRYARVTAELAEQRAPRGEVLARHGFDEDTWLLEDRGWLERIADGALAGDGTLAADFGARFQEAQKDFETDEERARTIDDHAEATVALESGRDPADVLKERGLSIPAWARLEARFDDAMQNDPALADRFDARCAALREEQARAADESTVTLDTPGPIGAGGAS